MGDFQDVFSCSIGGTAFQLNSYTKNAEGIFDVIGKRIGTKVLFTGRGDITTADASSLASALAAFAASATTDAADFTISAHDILKEQLLAADCLPCFLPRVKFAYGDEQGANYQTLTFTVEATLKPSADQDGILSETETFACQTSAEGLQTVTISGEVRTDGTVQATTVVLTGIGEPPTPKIPKRPDGWNQVSRYQRDATDAQCTYEITQVELVEDYPAALTGAILDGERTMTTAYDEHNRAVTTWSYDYTGDGAESFIEAMHTQLRAAGGLRQASISVTTHKTRHATAQFQVIAGRDGNLLEFQESVSYAGTGPVLEELQYPGLPPLLVQSAQCAFTVEQSGKAIGLSSYPKAPDPLFATVNYQEQPQTAFNRPNPTEWETTWRYKFLLLTQPAFSMPHGPDGSGGFY